LHVYFVCLVNDFQHHTISDEDDQQHFVILILI
jgi:hypothetical protein